MENPSFRGKPHLRCQTAHKCNVERQNYRCVRTFFTSKYIIFCQAWSLFMYRPTAAVWCAVPDLLLLVETQIIRHICVLACPSWWFCWFSCWLTTEMMSGINLLITLRIDWQTCCLTASHWLAALPLFSVLYGVAFRPSAHLKAPLEMRFATGLWNWNQEQEFTICFCKPKPLVVTVWCCLTHISRRFVLLCRFVLMMCWPRRNRSACCSEPSESAKASSRRSIRFLVSEKWTEKELLIGYSAANFPGSMHNSSAGEGRSRSANCGVVIIICWWAWRSGWWSILHFAVIENDPSISLSGVTKMLQKWDSRPEKKSGFSGLLQLQQAHV